MAGQVPLSEACLAMFAMLIVLIFVLIYYCAMPVYHGLKRRKEQQRDSSWERDPRWNGDKFRFTPKLPEEMLNDKKYSRLAACSRSSSVRSTVDNQGQMSIGELNADARMSGKPPQYSDLYESPNSSLASTPPQYASKTPSVEITSSNETVDQPKPNVRIIKPKKTKKSPVDPPTAEEIHEAAAKKAAEAETREESA